MSEIKLPRIYLIKRSAVTEEAVQHALNINPVSTTLVTDFSQAADVAGTTTVHVMNGAPVAIMADFEHPLVAINADGSVETIISCPAPEQSSKP